MPDASKYMNQTVQFRPKTGTDGFGKATFGPVEAVPARFVEKQQLIRNANGQEVMSSAEALMEREPKMGDTVNGRAVQNRKSLVAKDGTVMAWKAFL
jgi:hypothetical protein